VFNSEEERQKWLDNLKEGDLVAIDYGRYSSKWMIKAIDRITPKRIITVDGVKYNNQGISKRDSYYWTKLEPITQEIKDSIKKNKLVSKLDNINIADLSLEKLESIYEILKDEI